MLLDSHVSLMLIQKDSSQMVVLCSFQMVIYHGRIWKTSPNKQTKVGHVGVLSIVANLIFIQRKDPRSLNRYTRSLTAKAPEK